MTERIITIVCIFAVNGYLQAQAPTASDFLPPVRGGTTIIKKPEKVEINQNVIIAESPQDAVNSAVMQNHKAMNKSKVGEAKGVEEIGFKWFRFKSGGGYVSTGMGVYKDHPNPTAGLIAQRNAYVVAFMRAKSEAVKQLSEPNLTAKTELIAINKSLNTANESLQQDTEITDEQISIIAEKLLKGFVIWEINEVEDSQDPHTKIVYVSIACSPKTLTATFRSGAIIASNNLAAEIDELIIEVSKGVIPPVGGRIITDAKSNKTTWIGFGSAIVEQSGSSTLRAKNRLTAQRISASRASDSLLSMLRGDKSSVETGVATNVKTEFQENAIYELNNQKDNESRRKAISQFDSLTADQGSQEIIKSARSGKLPPGIQSKSWINSTGTWAYTISVLNPDLSEQARDFSRRMDEAILLEDAPVAGPSKANNSTSTEKVNIKIEPLPGGKVSPDNR